MLPRDSQLVLLLMSPMEDEGAEGRCRQRRTDVEGTDVSATRRWVRIVGRTGRRSGPSAVNGTRRKKTSLRSNGPPDW